MPHTSLILDSPTNQGGNETNLLDDSLISPRSLRAHGMLRAAHSPKLSTTSICAPLQSLAELIIPKYE